MMLLITVLCFLYFMQMLIVYLNLLVGMNFKSKKAFWFWNIPFIPCILFLGKKVYEVFKELYRDIIQEYKRLK